MPDRPSPHAAPPAQVIAFLRQTLPFNTLSSGYLEELARQCLIDFFPKGTLVFEQGVTEVTHFYLIQKGGVRIFLTDEDGEATLKDFRGEGEYFGAVPLLHGTAQANLNVETVEDTFCYLFPKEAFLHLMHTNPRVAQYYLRTMTEKLITSAYTELRQHKVTPRTESALRLVSVPVAEIVKGPPQMVDEATPVQEAAATMSNLHIGSLLVRDRTGAVAGIVTDKDLRTKVVARGLDFSTPVGQIMASPVQSVAGHVVCFDALLTMMSGRIHHLAVTRQEEVIGVVTTHDIMVVQGTSPLYLFREILAQQRIEGLYELSPKVPLIIRSLVEEGAKANNIARMITLLNDHILDRLLAMLVEELGPPPLPFCWLYMGSEGRREQTFKTDQDNAIIYRDPGSEEEAAEAARYFRLLGEKAIAHLTACGFPPCPGEIMASNPKWRQPASTWRACFEDWIYRPDPQEVRNATIFFDFRHGYGSQELARQLRDHLARTVQKQELFLLHLARDCMESRPPLSFFRNFMVEKDGEHKNRLDIKRRGLVPFVDFARVMALRYGVKATNTLDRLRLLAEGHHLPQELCAEAAEAYEFLMQLRLVHQLQRLEKTGEPDNFIDPGDLTDLEKQTMKEAFGVIGRLQSFVRQEFHLDRT